MRRLVQLAREEQKRKRLVTFARAGSAGRNNHVFHLPTCKQHDPSDMCLAIKIASKLAAKESRLASCRLCSHFLWKPYRALNEKYRSVAGPVRLSEPCWSDLYMVVSPKFVQDLRAFLEIMGT